MDLNFDYYESQNKRPQGMALGDILEMYSMPVPFSGCQVWLRGIQAGYGIIWWAGRMRPAHVVSYELTHGPVPEGLELDHLCRVRCCIKAGHLEAVTHRVNMLRSPTDTLRVRGHAQIAKTVCPAGHLYAGHNLYISPIGHRRCKECHRLRQQKRHALK